MNNSLDFWELTMGVDISTYRCRVGRFVQHHGIGVICVPMNFSQLTKIIGAVSFVRMLLVMSGIEENPGPQDQYLFRYQYLLIEIGTKVLREIFDVHIGHDFAAYLNSNSAASKTLTSLMKGKTRKITPDQEKLLPPKEQKPNSSLYDITLLSCLLRNVCGLSPTGDQVWMNPLPTDHSIEADITRLRKCRNAIMHINTVLISEKELNDKWQELVEILNRLNGVARIGNLLRLISDARFMDIDEELKQRYLETIKAWVEMDCVLDKIQQDVAGVKRGQSELQQDVAGVKRGQSELQEDVAGVKRGQSYIQQDVAGVKRGQSVIQQDVAGVKQGQSVIQQDVAGVKRGQSYIQQDVAGVKRGQSELQQDIAGVKRGQSYIQQDVAGVKRGQSYIQQDVAGVKLGQSFIQQDVAGVKRGQSYIQQDVVGLKRCQSYIQQNVAAFDTRVEHVEKILQGQQYITDLNGIQKSLVDFYRRCCKTLPVSPLFENKDENILSIFKYSLMYRVKCNGKETAVKKGHIYQNIFCEETAEEKNHIYKNIFREEIVEKEKKLKCYEDIFCKNGRKFEEIYIVGDAGVGKTSFCKYMSFLWSYAKSDDNLADKYEVLRRDVEYMSKFEFVFFVSLRDTCHTHVVNMIIEQLFGDNKAKYQISIDTILRNKRTLILMDGLDEWVPSQVAGKKTYELPDRIYSKNCVYVTTTRPYRIESVRLSSKDVDCRVEIEGFSGESSKSYIEDVIKYMNKEHYHNRHLADFISDMKRCKLEDELCNPIIASHLVALWFEQTLTNMPRALIYADVLEMLFKRAEKRGIVIPSPTVSKFQHLPDSLSGLKYLNKHVSLLFNVCHLSFRSLFKQDENASNLVFTVDQLQDEPYCFTDAEIDFLCKIGILSKNEVFGCYTVEKMKISFIHKNYLDFFAALFISSFDISQVFNTKWKLSYVLQSEHLIMLLVGFFSEGGTVLFDNLYQLMSDDLSLCRRNAIFHYDSYSYQQQIKSLQNVVIKCCKEVSRSNDPNSVLKLEDFIFDGNTNVDILKQLLLLNTTCVKSIHSVDGKYYDEFDQIQNLQCLYVGAVLSGDYVKFTKCMLQNQSTLHTVCIEGSDVILPPTLIQELPLRKHPRVTSFFRSLFKVQPVRSLQHLTSLSLSYLRMQHNSLHNLVNFLSDNVLIENIQLSFVYCANHPRYDSACTLTLNLPHHTQVTSLCLWHVNILCNNVNNSSIKSITLEPFSERVVRCYIDVFNCIMFSQLEHLVISGSHRYMLDYNTMKALTDTVKTRPYIKSLTLGHMKLPDDVLLRLHLGVTQVKIELEEVTLSRQCFDCFIESCVNNKSVIKVELKECMITSVDGETHMVLSWLESVDYMFEYLTFIPTVNITYKSDTWLHFET